MKPNMQIGRSERFFEFAVQKQMNETLPLQYGEEKLSPIRGTKEWKKEKGNEDS